MFYWVYTVIGLGLAWGLGHLVDAMITKYSMRRPLRPEYIIGFLVGSALFFFQPNFPGWNGEENVITKAAPTANMEYTQVQWDSMMVGRASMKLVFWKGMRPVPWITDAAQQLGIDVRAVKISDYLYTHETNELEIAKLKCPHCFYKQFQLNVNETRKCKKCGTRMTRPGTNIDIMLIESLDEPMIVPEEKEPDVTYVRMTKKEEKAYWEHKVFRPRSATTVESPDSLNDR